MHYSYSLRIWLTGRKAKSAFINDDKGFRIGSEVKAKIEKSRFRKHRKKLRFQDPLWELMTLESEMRSHGIR